MPTKQQTSDKPTGEINEYHKMEIQEIFTSIRTVNTLRIQVYSFFGTVNVTILGIAVKDKNVGLILLAASVIGVLILVDRQLRRYYYVVLSRGVQLEGSYAPDQEHAFMHQYAALSSFSNKGSRFRRYWLALFVLITEIVMALLSKYLLDWSWF